MVLYVLHFVHCLLASSLSEERQHILAGSVCCFKSILSWRYLFCLL